MKIVAISDIHGNLPNELPNGDVLVICGDILPLDIQRQNVESVKWINNTFVPWCHTFSFKKVFFIGGNHDFCLENFPNKEIDELVTYMENDLIEYDGVTFFGFPYIKPLRFWAFKANKELYDNMPNADVLICHDTPYIRQLFSDRYYGLMDAGNNELTKRLDKYKYVFCGHWHDASKGSFDANGTLVINCSLLNDDYKMVYDPFVIDI